MNVCDGGVQVAREPRRQATYIYNHRRVLEVLSNRAKKKPRLRICISVESLRESPVLSLPRRVGTGIHIFRTAQLISPHRGEEKARGNDRGSGELAGGRNRGSSTVIAKTNHHSPTPPFPTTFPFTSRIQLSRGRGSGQRCPVFVEPPRGRQLINNRR